MTQTEIAYNIACKAHAGQKRRDGTTAYINHPKDVANRLQGESDEVIAAAWLHDVPENTGIGSHDLRVAGISEQVTMAVMALTKFNTSELYISYIVRVLENPIARKVKIADILSNLADKPTKKQIVKYAKALLILLDV